MMVSTRKVRYRFTEGEKVLCYEPDPTKAKVLYDSKVLGIVETKDKRGRRLVQYKIHFQGWNSSWDRRVNEDFVLKDTDENRQLQKDLAEKAQLQLAAYLYRRERKKRIRKESTNEVSPKVRNRGSSEDGSTCSTLERNDSEYNHHHHHHHHMRDDCDTESNTSSFDSSVDEERVFLQIGERMKQYLEYDYEVIIKNKRQHNLPARMPVVTILENFVKQSAIKLVCCPTSSEINRRRSTCLRADKREKDVDKLNTTITLLKEVVDGLRIYFDFTLKDHLLYKEEKDQAANLLSEENLNNFTYIGSERQCPEFLQLKLEMIDTPMGSEISEPHNNPSESNQSEDTSVRRRLRSFRNDESDALFDLGFGSVKQETCFSSIGSTSSGSSTPQTTNTAAGLVKSIPPLHSNSSIPAKIKDFLQEILSWQILPSDAAPSASMIFGAIHLARLIVKLPEFLNASSMSDEKLKVVLQHLDSFIMYLETHKEWFGDHNYKDAKDVTSKSDIPSSSTG